jgi:hypothetical protein
LTRKPEDQPNKDDDKRQQYQFQTVLSAKRIHPELQQRLKLLAKRPDPLQNQPITITPILASDNKKDQKENNNDTPELLKTQIRAAQLRDKTCQRVVKKLQANDQHNYKVTLAHTSLQDKALFIDNKL